jgi:hypothetical protein
MRRTAALLLLNSLCLTTACGDDSCGPVAESESVIPASMATDEILWTNWRSSPNNDCGETGGPISLTVEADQMGSDRAITLCLPRPDKLSGSPVEVTDTTRIRIIDIFADLSEPGCLASLDRSMAASGQVAFPGICGDGQDSAGYSIDFDISVPMTVTCGADVTSQEMVFAAIASVTATPLP